MFHRTERLFLRPSWPEDWQAVLSGIGDERLVKNLARAPWPYHAEDAQRFVAREQDPFFPHFLCIAPGKGGQVLIGAAGIQPQGDEVELGYWIARDYWGRGFATEAARGVIEIARALGHRRLVASHFADNPASGRVLRKLGFQPNGRVGMRHSCARGEAVKAVEYELMLEAAEEETPRAA